MRIKTTLLITLLITFIVMISVQTLVYANTPVPIGATVQTAPFESNPTAHTWSVIPPPTNPTRAYDQSLDTFTSVQYTGFTGWFELKTFTTPSIPSNKFDINWVDFKISYRAAASQDDEYRIVYYVGNTGPVVLQDWVGGLDAQFRPDTGTQAHRAWSIKPEPNDGAWNWTDIANVRIRFETRMIGGADSPIKFVFPYEVWLTVYPAPQPPDGVSVQPSAVVGVPAGEIFFVDIYVMGIEKLWGFEFTLDYDTNVLTALDISLGHEYFAYHPLNNLFTGLINDTGGYVYLAFNSYFGDPTGLTGNAPMVRVYFQVDADGTSLLHLRNSIITNIYGAPVDKPATDGVFATSALRDIAITDVVVNATSVTAGGIVAGNVTVVNQGEIPEFAFKIVIFYNTSVIETKTVSLNASDTRKVGFNWNTTGVPAGTYRIKAEATVLLGETDTSDNSFTDGTVAVTQPPIASFTFTPTSPVVDEMVNFDASSSYDPDGGTITEYKWNFGDSPANETHTIPTANHTYSSPGDYTVTLTLTDDEAQINTTGKIITISKISSSITISAKPTTVRLGESTVISGAITPTRPGVPVTISYRPAGQSWSDLTTVDTNSTSQYTYTWAPTDVGTYELKSSWAGDADTLPAESGIITVSVVIQIEPVISITPTSGPIGTKIQVTGSGFGINQQVVLSFDDTPVAEVYASDDGNLTAVFNVPPSEAGTHRVKAWYDSLFVNITFTVIDVWPMDTDVEAGQIHFRGELTEFYIQTAFKGEPINATSIKATLYKPDGSTETLLVQSIATGLYKAPYGPILADAPVGTYVLVVEARYLTDIIDSKGTSTGSFLVSPTLTHWNALLININSTVAIIKTDVGLIEVKLDTIKDIQLVRIENEVLTINSTLGVIQTHLGTIEAKLISIDGTTATINSAVGLIQTDLEAINTRISGINGTVVTIKTDLGTMSGKINTMQGDVATIKTDIGTIKTILHGWTGGTISSVATPSGTFNLLALTTSTLESLTFSDNTITAVVSGSTGTSGTTNFVIPKQFLAAIGSTIEQVAATVNDNQVDLKIAEISDTYVLSTSYAHSTHTIKIFLAGIPPTQLPITTILMIVFAIVVIAGAATIYMKRLRKKTAKP